jgi:hypothetical protein
MGDREVMEALKKCEEFVQVVVDVEYLLSEWEGIAQAGCIVGLEGATLLSIREEGAIRR